MFLNHACSRATSISQCRRNVKSCCSAVSPSVKSNSWCAFLRVDTPRILHTATTTKNASLPIFVVRNNARKKLAIAARTKLMCYDVFNRISVLSSCLVRVWLTRQAECVSGVFDLSTLLATHTCSSFILRVMMHEYIINGTRVPV